MSLTLPIQVVSRSNYGTALLYPYNDAARTLCAITRTKTLDRRVLALAEQMGHTIEVVTPPTDWRA